MDLKCGFAELHPSVEVTLAVLVSYQALLLVSGLNPVGMTPEWLCNQRVGFSVDPG